MFIPPPRRWRAPLLALVAISLWGAVGTAAAIPATAAIPAAAAECGAPIVVPVAADSWIDENSSSNNFGGDAALKVRAKGPSDDSRALVRFPLPAAPVGCAVESATMRVYADSTTEGRTFEVRRLAAAWGENQVTWNNQPATTGLPATTLAGDGYHVWEVVDHVRAMYAPGANHGWLIRDAGEGGEEIGEHIFFGREKGEEPALLVLRFVAIEPGPDPEPQPPVPAAVRCGEVLTRSTQLTNDLRECAGDGIVIGAPRIIVDLNGRTVDGVGLGAGVRNDGYDGVIVRNGTIQEFDHGVFVQYGAKGNVDERLVLQDNQIGGVELSGVGVGNQVLANTLTGNGDGISFLLGTKGSLAADNILEGNSGGGLLVLDSHGNRLERNRVTGGGDIGIALGRSTGNTILGNTVSGNSDGGIDIITASHDNRIEGNTITASGDAGLIVIDSDRNVIVGNTSHEMSDAGISLSNANDSVVRENDVRFNPGGLQLDASSRNLIEGNLASETSGIGIEIGGESLQNRLVGNVADGNAAQGIYVADETTEDLGNLLVGNLARGNGAEGIVTAKGGHTLWANRADDNGGAGISAAAGTVDRGANLASGNQCSGVVCADDAVAPETEITAEPDDPSDAVTATFAFEADDAAPEVVLRFECRLDGSGPTGFVACTSPIGFTDLALGSHTFEVRAIDLADNVDPSPEVVTWRIGARPVTAIDSGPEAETIDTTARFTFSADQTDAEFRCALDDGGFEDCASPAVYENLTVGLHEFRVQAISAIGLIDLTPEIRTWRVLPSIDTTIDAKPQALTAENVATFEFSANTAGAPYADATFECALDGAVFAECFSPKTYENLADGPHTFAVRAIDSAGNVDLRPADFAWTVDTTAPIVAVPDDVEAQATSAAGAVVTFEVSAADLHPASPAVTCTTASGATFWLGSTAVECSAVDDAGNTGRGSFTVEVVDRVPPVLTLPAIPPVEATGPDGAAVTYTVEAVDAVDGQVEFACTPASGQTFGIATTTITCTASDSRGNEASGSFEVTVEDTTPPEVIGPGDLTREAQGPTGAMVGFTVSASDAVGGNTSIGGPGDPQIALGLTLACSRAPGTLFPLGATDVTCTATDAAMNAGSVAFVVTVEDTTAPALTVPADVIAEATGPDGARVDYPQASADDLVDPAPIVTCTPDSGGVFPLGTTAVDCSAADDAGNTATGSFTITVQDTTAPALTVPQAPVVAEAEDADGATVSYSVTAEDAVTASPDIACTVPGVPAGAPPVSVGPTGGRFPLGTTTVTCAATDEAGQTASASFDVRIVDTTEPTIAGVPAPIAVEATGSSGAAVGYTLPTATDLVDGVVDVECSPAPGAIFPLGATTVSCTATDAATNTATASFLVTVEDTTAPSLTLPMLTPIEATGPGGATVAFEATANDLVDGPRPVTCSTLSGATFALGTTEVECSAADGRGNEAFGSFAVTVQDTTDPVLVVPGDLVREAEGPDGAVVGFAVTASDAVGGSAAIGEAGDPAPNPELALSCAPAPGALFRLGPPTTLTCTATDAAGNTAEAGFTVEVVDRTPPDIDPNSIPADQTLEATGPDGATASFASPIAHDLVDGEVDAACVPASTSIFAPGTTDVTCTATDAAGNAAEVGFLVTVGDTTPPAVAEVSNFVGVEATGPGGAKVTFTTPTATDAVSGSPAVACAPASGSTFELGETTVTCSATDGAGNIGSSAFTVEVVDTTPPAFSLPPDVVVEATGPGGAAGVFDAAASDTVDGTVPVVCTPPSDSVFPFGITQVDCTATDRAGNTATGSFTIEVVDTTGPAISIENAEAEATGPDGAAVDYVASAVDLVDGSVDVACEPLAGTTFAVGATPVTCTAVDGLGNPTEARFEITVVDTTPPALELPADITVEAPGHGGATAEFAATAVDLVDDVVPVTCTPASGTLFPVGVTAVTCVATDTAGNEASGTFTVTVVDTTAPQTSIDAGPDVLTRETTASFTFSADEAGVSFACSLDEGPPAACTSPHPLTGLAAGDHSFAVRATDAAGNVDPTPATYDWTVDRTAPNISIGTGPRNPTNATSATISFVATDNETAIEALRFECRLDTQPFAACEGPQSYSGLSAGPHRFEAVAIDEAGNISSTAFHAWTIDTTAPQTTITAAPPATTTSTSARFEFSANEPVTGFACSLDGAAFVPCSSPTTYSGLAVQAHEFRVQATDAAGNTGLSPAVHAWTVVAQTANCGAPVTVAATADSWIDQNSSSTNKGTDSILKVMSKSGNNNMRALVRFALPPVPQGCVVESATLRLFAASAAPGRTLQAQRVAAGWSEGQVTWNNQPATAGPAATTASGTGYREWGVGPLVQEMYAGGNNGFLIRDAVEGQDAEQQLHAREKGQNPPQLVIRFAPAGTVVVAQALLVTAPPATTIASPPDVSSANADTTVAPSAREPEAPPATGSVDAAPPDTTPPDTAITAAPADPSAGADVTFEFSATEPDASLSCALDGGPAEACASPVTLTGLADGVHTFSVTAVDPAGNADPTPAGHAWTIDTAAPETQITSGPPSLTASPSATFAFASSEADAAFECALDDPAAFAPCPAIGANVDGVGDGARTLYVRAVDAAGNADPEPAAYPWTVDTTPPETVIEAGPSNGDTTGSATFVFAASETGATFECALDGGAFTPCGSGVAYADLAVGEHTFQVRAIDAAGNAEPAPASHLWTAAAPPDRAGGA